MLTIGRYFFIYALWTCSLSPGWSVVNTPVFSFIYFQNKDYYKQAYGTSARCMTMEISAATSSSCLVPEFAVLSYFKS